MSVMFVSGGCASVQVLISRLGLPEHLPSDRQAPRLQLEDMPYIIHSGTSAPASGPLAARTCHQE